MAGFAAQAICHAGDIFQEWDAVVSWNRWAIDWAANTCRGAPPSIRNCSPATCR